MKTAYILLVIVLAAAALGCVDKKAPETTSKMPAATAAITATAAPVPHVTPAPTAQPSDIVAESEVLDTGDDLTDMDTMFEDSNLDLSFSEVNADTFT